VIETHLHADFVSGHLELARRTGAEVCIAANAGAEYPHRPVRDGDEITLGDVVFRFLETPGHTPESISIVAEERGGGPAKVFTGDALFVGDVGRPDLVSWRGHSAEEMAHALYWALKDKLLVLPDDTEVWPAHGAGSACGRAISDEKASTIGKERATNPSLRYVVAQDEEAFVGALLEGLPKIPAYFPHDVLENRHGAPSMAEVLAGARALSPEEVEQLSETGTLVLDTRDGAEFGAGHVPGAVNIGLDGKFAPYVGVAIPPDSPLIVVADEGREAEVATRLARVGYERIAGWLAGGMGAWRKAGGETRTLTQVTPADLRAKKTAGGAPAVLDVRTQGEWDEGHVSDAVHIPLGELSARLADVPAGPVAVMCGSGYRSSIAASLLQRQGRTDVANVVGGWTAWRSSEANA
jgi:glyoxylase-like metal-dependent hydrolase (beta-lactamase superfamily II)/rhodanese-related sulfurtransferase